MDDPVASIADGWRNSSSHWSVLTTHRYSRIGCGITRAEGAQYQFGYRYYFVCIVADPVTATPEPTFALPDTAMSR
jgi:uncharacterized protein YkwD